MKMWTDPKWAGIAGGILLGLSFPPFPFPFLAVPGFALLVVSDVTSDSLKRGFIWPYLGLVLFNLIGTYWLMMATVPAGIASILANAGVMFIALRLCSRFLKLEHTPAGLKAAAAAAVWVIFEAIHHRWDLAWPWLSLGNAWASMPWAVQFYSVTGMLGGTFLMAWGGTILASFFLNQTTRIRYPWMPIVPFLASILMVVAIDKPDASSTVRVFVAQPNNDSYLPNSGFETPNGPAEALADLTVEFLKTDSADVILWPENGVDAIIYRETPSSIANVLFDLSRDTKTPVVSGASLYEVYPDSPDFITRKSFSGKSYDVFNAAILVDSTHIKQAYKKIHLVPIVERFPFADYILRPLSGFLDVRSMIGYGKGRELTLFSADSTTFPAFVCYDSAFPQTVRKSVLAGAGFISVITNDGWWGHSSGHIQHFAFARLRAIENRRFVVRSANNGISGIIDPFGRDVKRTEYWTKTGFAADIEALKELTIYSQFGDWLVVFMPLLMIGAMLRERF